MSPDGREPSGTKETGLFSTNYYPPCCHLSLLNRTFLNLASVSVFCSLGTFSSQVSSNALSFHGDRKYQTGGEFSRTHVTVDIPLPTGQMTPPPPRKKKEWMEKENSSWVQLYLSRSDIRSQRHAGSAATEPTMCYFTHKTLSDPIVFTSLAMTRVGDWNTK